MNSKSEKYKLGSKQSFLLRSIFLCLFFLSFIGFSQSTHNVTSGVDIDSIKIGEQIKFIINVEVDNNDQVIFPEGQTFSPLEMVESFAIDTIRENEKITLLKKKKKFHFKKFF